MLEGVRVCYRSGPFLVCPSTRTLSKNGQPVPLFPKSFDVLLYLVENAGRVVSKDELIKAVWPDTFVEESNLSQSISLLRKALDERPGENRYIITVPGKGYQFSAATPEQLVDTDAEAVSKLIVQASREQITAVIEQTDEKPPVLRDSETGRMHRLILVAITASGILALAGWFAYAHLRAHMLLGDRRELVLADIENDTSDLNFDHVLNDALRIDLEQSPYFTFLPPAKVQETLKQMKRDSRATLNAETAREVCERNNAQAFLAGSVARFGHKYVIALAVTDCVSGNRLLEMKREADRGDAIPGTIDALAADMRRELGESLASVQQYNVPLFPANTGSFEALTAYSRARQLSQKGKYVDAIPLFQRAIELDPKFAVAYLDLSRAYANLGERALEVTCMKKAYELRDNVDEQNLLLITALYDETVTGNFYQALRNLGTWTYVYPQSAIGWRKLADIRTQLGQPQLAIEPAKRALSLSQNNDGVDYVVLARTEMHAGLLEEAKSVCNEAMQRHLDGVDLHDVLIQLEYAQHDEKGVEAEIAWSKNKPAGLRVGLDAALIAFAQGRTREAQQLLQDVAQSYSREDLGGMAAFAVLATTRDLSEEGLTAQARNVLDTVPLPPAMTDPLVAMAEIGEVDRARSLLQQYVSEHPASTLWQSVRGPEIRAAIALAEHRPQDAIDALRPGIPYDLRNFDLPFLRGQAYLAAKQPAAAEGEFRKILDHPGVDPISYEYPLAQLGLAQAYRAEDKSAQARTAYNAFFAMWKDADPDVPVLQQAKAEYATLTTTRQNP